MKKRGDRSHTSGGTGGASPPRDPPSGWLVPSGAVRRAGPLTCGLFSRRVPLLLIRCPAWHDDSVDQSDLQANLRHLLNEWDPIGVADVVSDEYDCLIAPLLSKLSAGGGRSQISEFLWYELEDHFGLDPDRHDPDRHDVDALANRLVAWWAAAG